MTLYDNNGFALDNNGNVDIFNIENLKKFNQSQNSSQKMQENNYFSWNNYVSFPVNSNNYSYGRQSSSNNWGTITSNSKGWSP